MNYQNIYNNFIELVKSTPPRERLLKRDSQDPRLNDEKIYTEKHHIIPRSLGGNNSSENIVELLFEEHVFIHLLRYKIFNHKEDFYAVRLLVQTKNHVPNKISKFLKQPLKHYGRWKHFIHKEKLLNGYFTQETRKKISEARKGTFPMVCVKTGKMMGQFKKDRPKYISGEWVHHSKGKVSVTSKITGEKMYIQVYERNLNLDDYIVNKSDTNGQKNPNFKEMTEDRLNRILNLIPYSLHDNSEFVSKNKLESNLKNEMTEFKRISLVWLSNNFGKDFMNVLIEKYNRLNQTNYKYSKYYRGYKNDKN